MASSAFGLIVQGQPVAQPFTQVEETPNALRFVSAPFDIPSPRGSAVCLFLTTPLPEGASSSIHVSVDGGPYQPVANLLSNTSPSAIFRIAPGSSGGQAGMDSEMMADDAISSSASAKAVIGLSVEPSATIEALVAGLPKPQPAGGAGGQSAMELGYRIASKLVADIMDFAMSFAAGPSSGNGTISVKVRSRLRCFCLFSKKANVFCDPSCRRISFSTIDIATLRLNRSWNNGASGQSRRSSLIRIGFFGTQTRNNTVLTNKNQTNQRIKAFLSNIQSCLGDSGTSDGSFRPSRNLILQVQSAPSLALLPPHSNLPLSNFSRVEVPDASTVSDTRPSVRLPLIQP